MRTPGSQNRYTAKQLRDDSARISEFLGRITAVAEKMAENKTELPDIRVEKDASFRACLRSVKAWAKSIDDGFDEAVTDSRGGKTPEKPAKKHRQGKGRKTNNEQVASQ